MPKTSQNTETQNCLFLMYSAFDKKTQKRITCAMKRRASASSAEASRPAKKQKAGEFGIYWHKSMCAWQVQCPKFDSDGRKIAMQSRTFGVKKFMASGRTEEQARTMALGAAEAFREELVKKGAVSEANPKMPKDPACTSEVRGVYWARRSQKWKVEVCLNGKSKRLCGGSFVEKAAAEAKALQLREQHSLPLQRRSKPKDLTGAEKVVYWQKFAQKWTARIYVKDLTGSNKRRKCIHGGLFNEKAAAEAKAIKLREEAKVLFALPVFQPKVPHPGVKWDLKWEPRSQQWHAERQVGGVFQKLHIPTERLDEPERLFQASSRAVTTSAKCGLQPRPKLCTDNSKAVKPKGTAASKACPGVYWNKPKQRWQAQLYFKGRNIYGGYFTDKAAAEAKAAKLREKHTSSSTLPVFRPKVPHPGVEWDHREQQWRAQCRSEGNIRTLLVKPLDHSEAEKEHSFNIAMAWKKKQEEQSL